MEYEVVEEYPRRGQFDFYSEHPSPFYAVTWSTEIAELKAWAARNEYSIYLVLCYYMVRAMQSVEDFRYRLLDGRIVLYDRLDIGMTLPTPDGQYAFGHFDFHEDVSEFMRRVDVARSKIRVDGVLRPDDRPNRILFTSAPGVPFTSMSHVPLPDPGDARPNVAFGQFASAGDEVTVPISLQVNHRFIGGRALGELVEAVAFQYTRPD